MKPVNIFRLIPVVLCIALLVLTSLPSLLLASASQQNEEREGEAKIINSQILRNTEAASRVAAISKSDEEFQALSKNLSTQGYRAQTKPENHFGWDFTIQSPDGQTGKVTLLIQDYAKEIRSEEPKNPAEVSKETSTNPAAIGTISINSLNRCYTYSFSVIALGSDYKNVIEYKVDEKSLKVVKANSLWSCFTNRLQNQCVSDCVKALVTCSPNLILPGGGWAAYLSCLVIKCASCAAKAFACCVCDSRWWCRGACGRCSQ